MIHLTGPDPPASDLTDALADSRKALAQLIAAGEQCGKAWATPRAPGKWSPSQIVEHVARVLEESAKSVNGEPSAFPTLPRAVRPLLRVMFFTRVIRNNAFFNGRTNRAMNPSAGPATVAAAKLRLQAAHLAFERACRACGTRFNHSIFGNISTADYARFQALHTAHHAKQIPGP